MTATSPVWALSCSTRSRARRWRTEARTADYAHRAAPRADRRAPIRPTDSFGQRDDAKRLAERACKRRVAVDAGKLLAVAERRLQFQDPHGRGPGFFEAPELCQRRRQQHMGNAVSRIELDRLVGC